MAWATRGFVGHKGALNQCPDPHFSCMTGTQVESRYWGMDRWYGSLRSAHTSQLHQLPSGRRRWRDRSGVDPGWGDRWEGCMNTEHRVLVFLHIKPKSIPSGSCRSFVQLGVLTFASLLVPRHFQMDSFAILCEDKSAI